MEFKTLVIDSATAAEMAARNMHRFVLNPGANKDQRQWFAGSTDALELSLFCQVSALPCNVVVLCHVDQDKDERFGMFVRNPRLPGRLRSGLGSAYGEFYHLSVEKEGRKLQTVTNEMFGASTQIQAPDGVYPDYELLWSNWDKLGYERALGHWLVYGDSGAGKSTFAATFPKPILVLCFEGIDKATPYRILGKADPLEKGLVRASVGSPAFELSVQRIFSKEEKDKSLLVKIEYYHDPYPYNPTAFSMFSSRLDGLLENLTEVPV